MQFKTNPEQKAPPSQWQKRENSICILSEHPKVRYYLITHLLSSLARGQEMVDSTQELRWQCQNQGPCTRSNKNFDSYWTNHIMGAMPIITNLIAFLSEKNNIEKLKFYNDLPPNPSKWYWILMRKFIQIFKQTSFSWSETNWYVQLPFSSQQPFEFEGGGNSFIIYIRILFKKHYNKGLIKS